MLRNGREGEEETEEVAPRGGGEAEGKGGEPSGNRLRKQRVL